jgi:plastocyanin
MQLKLLIALPLLGAAQPMLPGAPTPVTVTLDNFRFGPPIIQMVHGRPYVLHLVSRAKGGHDFTAPKFFAASGLDVPTRARVGRGEVEVPAHGSVAIQLIAPPPGRYKVKCSHFMHGAMGMKGEIIVD